MAWVAVAGAGASVLGGILGKKQDKKMAQSLRTTLADRNFMGAGGAWGRAGDEGASYDLGVLNPSYGAYANQAYGAIGRANDMMYGVPEEVRSANSALNYQGLDLGTFLRGEAGANMLGGQALRSAFDPSRTAQGVYESELSLLRRNAAPQEETDRRAFISDLYGSGRGAVTGVAGNEASMGGGRLAAAFAQGQSRADLDRQLQARTSGFNAAANEENLISSAFSRFSNMQGLAADFNTNAYNRQRNQLEGGFQRSVQMAGLPAELAAAFQGVAGNAINGATSLGGYGLDMSNQALQTAAAGANVRIGSSANVAGYMQNRSTTPTLDAIGRFAARGAPAGGGLADVFGAIKMRRGGAGGNVDPSTVPYWQGGTGN